MNISSQIGDMQFSLTADKIHPVTGGMVISGANVSLQLPFQPKRFYRHGWQSWSLAAWIDPSTPPVPISALEFRNKDEDPLYATADHHISAGVAAVESPDGQVILLGALGLAGRVELDGDHLRGFYETGSGDWFLSAGDESQVFARYAELLGERFGKGRAAKPPRVWCSWYSLYNLINETAIQDILGNLGNLPFDVFQVDDGWQVCHGDWEPNKKFPSGMAALAGKISATNRIPGLWLAPLMVSPGSSIVKNHPDWLLQNEEGIPINVGQTWGGAPLALDTSHPAVLEWLDALIRKVRDWGYGYLKLDFLYAGALPGKRYKDIPRETAYREALQVMRGAAGDAYVLACGAPIFPSLGLCNGMRVGPDVTPYWLNTPMSVWLNNPNHPSTQNAIRTSLHRLWLNPLVHTDPDVIYFRSRHNALTPLQKSLLRDLGLISGFKATSDLPQWLKPSERIKLREFLESEPKVERLGRTRFRMEGRDVEYATVLPLPGPVKCPPRLATFLGFYNMAVYEILPALFAIAGKKK